MTQPHALPQGPLIAFYGDDFTGSSAAMEATAFAGVETVLFLSAPSPERLTAFAHYRAIGVAGISRAQSPAWMDEHLPAIYRLLADTGAPIIHYKLCSTFDSAPTIGSIGRAADIAATLFDGWFPLVVADPGMGRYQACGNLFAFAQDGIHRLDRHPVMSRHPVTPMDEADLNRHLAKQTDIKIGLVDFVAMKHAGSDARLRAEIDGGAKIVSLDVLDAETLAEAGRLIWTTHGAQQFCLGSQGVEAALVAHWRKANLIPDVARVRGPTRVDRIACVSGSVSPVTASQIACAREKGFATIALDAARAVDPRGWQDEVARATTSALAELSAGRDALVYTAAGPDDPAVAAFRTSVATSGIAIEIVNERIGEGLGKILERIVDETRLPRVVISGGDTSGRAASLLGIDALTAIAPLAPGSPLCRAHAERQDRDGLEIALKGGQVGAADYFVKARDGA